MKLRLLAAAMLFPASVLAEKTVEMHEIGAYGVGKAVGEITITETEHGAVFTPDLQGLGPGLHGFHVHQEPSCEAAMKDGSMAAGVAAGGHYDPDGAGRHGAPWGDGHLGDLPALYVNTDQRATHPVLAPRLKLAQLEGRALMIHAGGDNYRDEPEPLGGGGARMVCGVIGG